MCALENVYDLETSSMDGAIDKWKMRKLCTVRCSKLELHWKQWREASAQKVGEGIQSKILMCRLENSSNLVTSSMVDAISKWRMRRIIHRKVLQSRAALKAMVKLYSAKSGRKCTVQDDAHRFYLVLEPRNEQQGRCHERVENAHKNSVQDAPI